jgi:hypothetical protein
LLVEGKLPKYFWAEAVNTSCYIINRVMVRPTLKKTSYELLKGKKPTLSYFRVFGCKVFIHNNDKKELDKFDPKSEPGIFLGYSDRSRAYKVFNSNTKSVEETPHVVFDENMPNVESSCRKDDGDDILEEPVKNLEISEVQDKNLLPEQSFRYTRNHPIGNVIGNWNDNIRTRSHFKEIIEEDHMAFISQVEPKNISEALKETS